MSIIVTEEDLCKKHDKVSAIFSSFSILPQNVVQPQCRGCSKMTLNPNVCPYNCNTLTGFCLHKKYGGQVH